MEYRDRGIKGPGNIGNCGTIVSEESIDTSGNKGTGERKGTMDYINWTV